MKLSPTWNFLIFFHLCIHYSTLFTQWKIYTLYCLKRKLSFIHNITNTPWNLSFLHLLVFFLLLLWHFLNYFARKGSKFQEPYEDPLTYLTTEKKSSHWFLFIFPVPVHQMDKTIVYDNKKRLILLNQSSNLNHTKNPPGHQRPLRLMYGKLKLPKYP